MDSGLGERHAITILGDGARDVVFAHGFGCDQNMWRFVAPALSRDHRVVLYDLMGAGRSRLGDYDFERYQTLHGHARDLLAIARAYTRPGAVFVGHSVAAMIGLLAGIEAPELFGEQVMVGPSPCYVNDGSYVGGFSAADIDALLEFRVRGVDGVERTVRATGKTFCDAAGTPSEFVGMLEDYTERRATEAALRAAEQEARTQLQFREQLIGIVSHDLRSPIQTIKLGADLLLGSAADAVAQRIARAANRAARLVAELLDFTQVRLGGGMRIARVHSDVAALAEAVADELRLAWPKRAIVQRHEGEHHALVDPDRLSQVITNLATNALVYGDPSAAVTIRSQVGAGALSLCVHNRGPAIPEDVQARMFEPMERGVEHVSSAVRSVGLGLFIVRAIATAHGGSVTARSTEAEGTTFELRLPSG